MIVFNEGLPRAGKSYDAVAQHILPAIVAGRNVYARLNGLDHARIAAHLKLPEQHVRQCLHLVEPNDVRRLADTVVPDSLIVIDECHEFYVASRQELPADQERFFAMHGHAGLDIVLISQFYKRLHSAVRGRVERKNLFRKMTAVGMKSRYVVAFYAAVAPDKFEKTGSETRKYDPAIFDLYAGFAPGTGNTEVYDSGAKPVFSGRLRLFAIIVPLAAIWGVWKLVGFFSGGGQVAKEVPAPISSAKRPPLAASMPAASPAPVAVKPEPQLSPETRYIVDLNAHARPRLAGWIQAEGQSRRGLVEWVSEGGVVIERMELGQVRALGWVVNVREFGLLLKREKQTVIVTSWPRDFAGQYTAQDHAKMGDALSRSPSASEPPATPRPVAYESLPAPGRPLGADLSRVPGAEPGRH